MIVGRLVDNPFVGRGANKGPIDNLMGMRPGTKLSAGERTKAKIATALEELMSGRSFEGITVMEIAEKAGISRQTFYNHFFDKYDLVNWVYRQLILNTTCRIGIDMTWEQAVRTKLEIMKANEAFYSEIYRLDDRSSPLSNEARIVFDSYQGNLNRVTGKILDEFEEYLLMLYCHGATRMTAEWAKSGMHIPVDTIVRADKMALPGFVQQVFFSEKIN